MKYKVPFQHLKSLFKSFIFFLFFQCVIQIIITQISMAIMLKRDIVAIMATVTRKAKEKRE